MNKEGCGRGGKGGGGVEEREGWGWGGREEGGGLETQHIAEGEEGAISKEPGGGGGNLCGPCISVA